VTIPKEPIVYGLYRFLPPSVYGPSPQNPAPFDLHGQIDADRVRSIADQIVKVFLNSLPSNYVSTTKGPYYAQQFQAIAEELARIQVLLADAYEDNDYDFTRTEVLFQFLATLVFPDSATSGLPQIDGDITYREFLKRMVAMLLQGSKKVSLVGGLEALTDANVTIIEKVRHTSDPGTLWTMADQFTYEVSVENYQRTGPTTALSVTTHYHTVTVNTLGSGTTISVVYASGSGPDHTHTITDFVVQSGNGTGQALHTHDLLSTFPDLPIILQRNAALVLAALDPAHTLYEYRNLFRENLRGVITDSVLSMDMSSGFYEDFRHDCSGVRAITGTHGIVGADRYLFHDPTLSFRSVPVGATLVIPVVPTPPPSSHQPREHRYTVTAVLSFPYGNDPTPRAYTTSPTGLTGLAKVLGGAIVDTTQDFALCVPGEVLVLTTGPNAGTYLLDAITGIHGGPFGSTATPFGPSTGVLPVPSWLRVTPKIVLSGTGISYTVSVNQTGVRTPITVTNEDASWYFFGPGASSTLFTAHGPLVKNWGDATPAEVADVTVRYDGVPVTISAINPYTGEITLAAPIGPFAPGAHTVTISYQWFNTPVVGLAGLNNKGLTLNRWGLRKNRDTSTVTLSPASGLYGGIRRSRFPMGVTLGRFSNRKPAIQIAHRYIGFEKGYTAALNSPTTLILNQAPGRISVPYAVTDSTPQSFSFDGNILAFPWVSVGNVQGSLSDGYYTLIDADTSQMAYWKRDFPLPISTNVTMGSRIEITQYTLDGVFTGIGFGFHNNQRLFLAGALEVTNPVAGTALRHIGILLRPGVPSEASSWEIGPSTLGQVQKPSQGTTYDTVALLTASVPMLLTGGNKFQVLAGNQTGVYTILDLFQSARTGKTYLVVDPPFPADPTLFGNRDVTMCFDTAWDEGLCTWRLYANTRSGAVSVVFGGSSGSTTTVSTGIVASPAYLGPDILPEGYGRVVWGSFSRYATNSATWDFVRTSSIPDGGYAFSRGVIIDTQWAYGTITCRTPLAGDTFTIDTSPAPISGPVVTFTAGTDFLVGTTDSKTATNIARAINASIIAPNYVSATASGVVVTVTTNTSGSPGSGILFSTVSGGRLVLSGVNLTGNATDPEYGDWYLETPFGDTRSSGSTVTITSTPASDALGTYYGYGFTDPFLNGRRVCAFDAKLAVSRDTAGVGGATLMIQDSHKEVRLATIRYQDNGALGKIIFRTDTITLVGSTQYWQQGWDGIAGSHAYPNGPEMRLTGDGDTWTIFQSLTPYYFGGDGRFMELRASIETYTLTSGRIGLTFACNMGTGPKRAVFLDFRTGSVVLAATPGGAPLLTVAVPWDDGNARTYSLEYVISTGLVYLRIDGALGGSVALGLFAATIITGDCEVQTDGTGRFTANLRALVHGNTDEGATGLGRTFGLYRSGGIQDINSWAIPRSDGASVPNSDPSSVFIPMDWSTECWVRIFLDPTYGAAFLRPDLTPPPGYTGTFATQSMSPSAGWVSVEYADLPHVTQVSDFGTVSFGPLNPAGSVISQWSDVRYRLFTNTSVDYTAPQGMVLNRWNVVTSNEFAKDTTPEVVVVSSVTQNRVSLRPCHIFADRVFAVEVDGSVIPSSLWTFNKTSQDILLLTGLQSAGYPVTVTFAPGRPITNTYLATQPMAQSQTILNEGTPTFQESQSGRMAYSTVNAGVVSGSGGRTPLLPPTPPTNPTYFLRDQYIVREFSDDTQYLYERMDFIQLDDGGQKGRLSSYCEGGPGPNGTWGVIEFGLGPTGSGSGGMGAGGGALMDSYALFTIRGTGYGRNHGPGQYRYIIQASGAGFDGGVLNTTSYQDRTTQVIAPFSGATPVTTDAEPRMLYPTAPADGAWRGTDYGGALRETLFVLRTGAPPGVVTIWTGSSQLQTWG